jgi:DNA-binding transcriptional ArsR family regulator
MPRDIWQALADPTRRSILDCLAEKPLTTGDLCAMFAALDRCTVMKHLDVLCEAGLVISERQGRSRINHLNSAPLLDQLERWLGRYRTRTASAALRMKERIEGKQGKFGLPNPN